MSKKKNKFKKKKTHKPSYTTFGNVREQESVVTAPVALSETVASPTDIASAEIAQPEKLVPIYEADANDPRYKAMRKDVQKILITFACLGVILVGAYFLNSKTTVLDSFGNWIYKIANIQVL